MEKWGMFEFNTPYVGEIIEKINDVVLPNDYIEFMKIMELIIRETTLMYQC